MQRLSEYLNDHLAGGVAALELLDRLIEVSQGKALERFFLDLRGEIEVDHETLKELMAKLGAQEGAVRKAGAWIMEKFSRTKIQLSENGNGEGEMGLFLALEALALGITGKRLLWRALAAAAETVAEYAARITRPWKSVRWSSGIGWKRSAWKSRGKFSDRIS